MKKGKNFELQGEHYEWLDSYTHKLRNGKFVQITDYLVTKAGEPDGDFYYEGIICELPKGYESIDFASLNDDCKNKVLQEGILSKEDLK